MQRDYPKYLTYEGEDIEPTVLFQKFPAPILGTSEVYYPINVHLTQFFSSEIEAQKFGASQFCSFLSDTIEVEHCIVIPAIASLRRIPFKIPSKPVQDLYKTATDEGFHAEQSLRFLSGLEDFLGLPKIPGSSAPLFIRRLESQRANEENPIYKHLITVLNGVVTETRISVELSKFAGDRNLSTTVREVCRSHAEDEVIHSSQFQALGSWLWEDFDEKTKVAASDFLINSTIARSMPDIDNLTDSFVKATGRSYRDACLKILEKYNEDLLVNEMLVAAKPTFAFLSKIGVEHFSSFESAIELEKQRLATEITNKKKSI